jgi:hypothetical protein
MDTPVPSVLATEPSSSSSFVVFEVTMILVAIGSFFVIRRRRRMLEQRAMQRYERLSRVELGDAAVAPVSPSAAAMGAPSPSSS